MRGWLCVLVVFAALSSGCASSMVPSAKVPVAVLSSPRSPVAIHLVSERRINDTLELLVEVQPVVVWPSDSVAIEVTALKDGEVLGYVAASPKVSSNAVSPDGLLRPGTAVRVPISLSAPGMTDYRLDVKWGAPSLGSEVVTASGGAGSDIEGRVELADVTLAVIEQPCADQLGVPNGRPPRTCARGYLYTAVLQNRTNRMVSSVVLAADFRAMSGALGEASEISMADLKMVPGDDRALRVTFDAPENVGGAFDSVTPRLRVVSFE